MTMASLSSFNWLAIVGLVGALIGGAGLGGMLKTWLDYKRTMRRQTDDVSISLVHQMQARLATVEAAAERQDRNSARERLLCDAQLRAEHHRGNNLDQCFTSLLMMHEIAPEKGAEAIQIIKEERERQRQREMIERTAVDTLAASLIAANEAEGAPDIEEAA